MAKENIINKFAKAKKAVIKKERKPIPLTDEMRREVIDTIRHKNTLISGDPVISDTSDAGDYRVTDTKGKVLFELFINPYTIRLFKGDKLVAETHIVVNRGNSQYEDEIMIPDSNMEDVVYEFRDAYERCGQKKIVNRGHSR